MEAEPAYDSRGSSSPIPHSIPPGFRQLVHQQSRPTQLAPSYQAPTQAPASSSQSTPEDTLKAFIQLIGQSINDVKNATMVNTQATAKMETQIGQIASHLGEREKGKLPSQPVLNPKLQLSHLGQGDKWTTKWFFLKRTLLHKKDKEAGAQWRKMRSHPHPLPLLRFLLGLLY
jgi:hypothetical protein